MENHHRHLTDQQLLSMIDRELPARQLAGAERHLAGCAQCQDRRAALAHTSAMFRAAYQDPTPSQTDVTWSARGQLRARLHEAAGEWHQPGGKSIFYGFVPTSRWAITAVVLVAAILIAHAAFPARPLASRTNDVPTGELDALPVASLTPGATWNLTAAELCADRQYEQRPIPESVRERVLQDYGMQQVPRDEYELDYLITPELGGAPDARNLWPQRYTSRVWNARVKDQLERLLPRLVCSRRLTLRAAQADLSRDWIAAYRRYFHTDLPLRADATVSWGERHDESEDDDLRFPVWRTAGTASLQLISFSAAP